MVMVMDGAGAGDAAGDGVLLAMVMALAPVALVAALMLRAKYPREWCRERAEKRAV
jgi:hypothetical protein